MTYKIALGVKGVRDMPRKKKERDQEKVGDYRHDQARRMEPDCRQSN